MIKKSMFIFFAVVAFACSQKPESKSNTKETGKSERTVEEKNQPNEVIASPPLSEDAVAGKNIVSKIGCLACHSLVGSKLVGPSFKHLYGHEMTVTTDGTKRTATVDEEYLKRSIYKPNADIMEGYSKGLMISYEGQLTDKEVGQIIEYIKVLR